MLAAKADFPTPGDPLIQIILWPPVFLTSVSIACRMSLRVPSMHDLRSLSFFPPRALTFFATVFSFYDIKFSIHECWLWITDNLPWIYGMPACMDLTLFAMVADTTNQTTWTMNISTETRPCSTKICIWRSLSNLSAKASRLSRNSIALPFWAATRMYLTGTTDSVKNPSQISSHVRVQFLSHFWIKNPPLLPSF